MESNNWRTLPFDQAVEVNPIVPLKRGENYPFVDMQSVQPFTRSVSSSVLREFSGGGAKFRVGDTLMARITPCLENGKVSRFVSDDPLSIAHGSTEFIVIRGRDGISDNEYAYYLTIWDEVRQYAISQMTGTSGRQRVPTSSLNKITVPLPPLPEQRAIAAVLGALADKIELNRRMNATLEGMARALFKSWFVDFDPVRRRRGDPPWSPSSSSSSPAPEGRHGDLPLPPDIAALFPDEMVVGEDEVERPLGWGVKPLDEIATYLNGLALQKYPANGDDYLPVIKIAQLRKGNTDGADRASHDIPLEYIINDGDILFSWSGSLEVVIWCGGRGALNQHLFKVASNEYPKWYYYLWTKEHLTDFQEIAAGKATTMGHIQRKHLTQAKALVPARDLMEAMDKQISPIIERIVNCNVESRTLAALRDTLLPKLMSGEVRVSLAEEADAL